MESEVGVTEERIPHSAQSIDQCFPANISESDSSVSADEPLPRFSLSIESIFPATISESDNSSVSYERLSKFCPSIQSIFPATSTQTNSPANNEIIDPYDSIESCFPPRCDSDSDSLVPYDINIINRYLRSFSIQSFFPPCKSSTSVDSDSSFNFESYPNKQILEKPNLKEFTFADLKTAARNFKPAGLVGEGGFGRVFKGWMDEKTLSPSKVGTGMIVAIKKLNPEGMRGFFEWQTEVNFLGRSSHPNLVKLLGYCWEDQELLLVHEFIQEGSLDNYLFRRNNYEPLSWKMRLKIVIEVARGLAFLHSSEKPVIHGDVKGSNILLDRNFNAKISEFGMEKLGSSSGDTHVSTRVMGTYDNVAPEYVATGHLYVKSDVYGFGVVLIEMLTGLQALDKNRPRGRHNLVEWLGPSLSNKRKWKAIIDMRMNGQYSSKAAFQTIQLALKCLELDHRIRPSMKDVVEALERIEAIEEPKETLINSTHCTSHGHGRQPFHHCSSLHSRNLLSYLRIRTKRE